MSCLVLGDSIAVGISHYSPECSVVAKSGITSTAWIRKYGAVIPEAQSIIISLGSNDYKCGTLTNLLRLRRSLSGTVYWILPSAIRKPAERKAVVKVATQYGDQMIDIRSSDLSRDGIHPTARGYKRLAEIRRR